MTTAAPSTRRTRGINPKGRVLQHFIKHFAIGRHLRPDFRPVIYVERRDHKQLILAAQRALFLGNATSDAVEYRKVV